jgi:hypothetical protein
VKKWTGKSYLKTDLEARIFRFAGLKDAAELKVKPASAKFLEEMKGEQNSYGLNDGRFVSHLLMSV